MGKQKDRQRFESLEPIRLLSKAADLKEDGFRLVQICAVPVDEGAGLLYSFEKEGELNNYLLELEETREVESLTRIYWPAFIYENEINTIYGIKFNHSQLDYGGAFMVLSQKSSGGEDDTADEGRDE